MATNQNKQSFLNKSRADKFTLVFSLPPALRKIDSKTDRTTFNVNEDAFQFSVFGAVVPEINVPAIQIGYGGSNLYNSAHAKEPFPPVTVDFTIDNGLITTGYYISGLILCMMKRKVYLMLMTS